MRKKKTANLRLETQVQQTHLHLQDWIEISIITLLTGVGWALWLADMLSYAPTVPVLITIAWCIPAIVVQKRKLRPWCIPGSLALGLILCLVLWNSVRSALAAVANDFLLWLSGVSRYVYLTYTDADAAKLPLLLTALGPVIGGLCAWVVNSGKRWGLVPLILPAIGCLIGWLNASPGMLLLTLAAVLFLTRCIQMQHGSMRGFVSRAGCIAVVVIVAVFLGVALSGLLNGLDLRQDMDRGLHSIRYDNAINSMPEGDLQDLDGWKPTNDTALEVTMDEPQKLYLRGFVGETYENSTWSQLGADTAAEYADLFYWMHQNDFYGQGILAGAYQTVGQGDTVSITVKNVSACSQRLCLPYMADVTNLADERMIGDTQILAAGDTYTTSYYPGSIPQWFALQNIVAETDMGNFGVCEQAYAAFAHDNYLYIPDDIRAVIADAWGNPASGRSLSQIKDEILTFMEENMTYQPYLSTNNGKVDFVTYTLQQSHKGYSVHYATLATLMLRYYGIPARYCEGYFISAEQAEKYTGGELITLDETYAHAWTEYYLDGVGWIPFEVTPGYVDKEELEGEGIGGGGKTYTSPQHLPDILQPENEEPEGNRPSLEIVGWVVLGLLLLLLLAVVLLLILRRLQLRRKLDAIARADNRTAIVERFAYVCWLMHHVHRDVQEVPDYAAVRALQLEALYSAHSMTDAQRQKTDDFAAAALELCRSRWDRLHQWYYRWIKCLY